MGSTLPGGKVEQGRFHRFTLQQCTNLLLKQRQVKGLDILQIHTAIRFLRNITQIAVVVIQAQPCGMES